MNTGISLHEIDTMEPTRKIEWICYILELKQYEAEQMQASAPKNTKQKNVKVNNLPMHIQKFQTGEWTLEDLEVYKENRKKEKLERLKKG